MRIEQSTFIVTGGASGLGQAVVTKLVALGANVSIFDRQAPTGTLTKKEKIFWPGSIDITSEEQVLQGVTATFEKFQNLSGVINSAGVGAAFQLVNANLEAHPLDLFKFVVDVNLVGTFNVCRLAAQQIIKAKAKAKRVKGEEEEAGVFINVASIAYQDGQDGQTAYAASKGNPTLFS